MCFNNALETYKEKNNRFGRQIRRNTQNKVHREKRMENM